MQKGQAYQGQKMNQGQCSLCKNLIRPLKFYTNPFCGHIYCRNCICNRHVPDKSKIRCFVYNCQYVINVDDMDEHFMKLQLEQMEEKEQLNDLDENCQGQKKQPYTNAVQYQDVKQSQSTVSVPKQEKYLDNIQNSQSEIKLKGYDFRDYKKQIKMTLEDTKVYCGNCYQYIKHVGFESKFCQIHQFCYGCLYKLGMQNYYKNSCMICNRCRDM